MGGTESGMRREKSGGQVENNTQEESGDVVDEKQNEQECHT